jgi:hypothetical protein
MVSEEKGNPFVDLFFFVGESVQPFNKRMNGHSISVCNLLKILKNKRFRPFCLCPPDVMFVTRGSKNSLFFVFDSLSNLDCGQ